MIFYQMQKNRTSIDFFEVAISTKFQKGIISIFSKNSLKYNYSNLNLCFTAQKQGFPPISFCILIY